VAPDVTLKTVGGSQAISRRRTLVVDAGDGPFDLAVPSLAGALQIKTRAATSAARTREKHLRDLARLLALVPDPAGIRAKLGIRDRAYLRAHEELLDLGHPAWRGIPDAENGLLALGHITR